MKLLISLCVFIMTLINAHPEFMLANAKFRSQMYCHVTMTPTMSVMGYPLKMGTDATVTISDGAVRWNSKGKYEYFFEVTGATFAEGGCGKKRSTEDRVKLVTDNLKVGDTASVIGYYSNCTGSPGYCPAYYTATAIYKHE